MAVTKRSISGLQKNAAAYACSPARLNARCKKKAPGVPGLFKEMSNEETSRDQGALDAPMLSQSTNQARRGSRKRPGPPGCEEQGGQTRTLGPASAGLFLVRASSVTAIVLRQHHTQPFSCEDEEPRPNSALGGKDTRLSHGLWGHSQLVAVSAAPGPPAWTGGFLCSHPSAIRISSWDI